MFSHSVIPATAAAVLILSAPASAAGSGPDATPLILELVLGAVVVAGLALRGPTARALAAARRRVSRAARRPAKTGAARARGA